MPDRGLPVPGTVAWLGLIGGADRSRARLVAVRLVAGPLRFVVAGIHPTAVPVAGAAR
ncbi:hypothetical protein [Nocardia stercoris]|uniref:hypothetical protein n=1 Tax=Nocardia stercoris TaxID=2483361 RepID=UPI001319F357|nr:hypothetical protein [Nocardia stercoris]